MLYFSSLLKSSPQHSLSAENLFSALSGHGETFRLFDGAKDIWARDYMPVKTKSGKYVSFRYEPSYLKNDKPKQTDYCKDVAPYFNLPVTRSKINLDGGNVVFSPSKEKVVITDRIFPENPAYPATALLTELEKLLEAEILIIPSLKTDMTGHADGVVRFVDETTMIGNTSPYKTGYEARVKKALSKYGISVMDFPYFEPAVKYPAKDGDPSAVGSYLNFLETEKHIFLPIFENEQDDAAIKRAKELFDKETIPVNINSVAEKGGVLNCISWETN